MGETKKTLGSAKGSRKPVVKPAVKTTVAKPVAAQPERRAKSSTGPIRTGGGAETPAGKKAKRAVPVGQTRKMKAPEAPDKDAVPRTSRKTSVKKTART